jgi:hypothetical protein
MAISDRQIICHAGRQLAGCSALFNELFLRLIPEGIAVAFGFTGRFPKKIVRISSSVRLAIVVLALRLK